MQTIFSIKPKDLHIFVAGMLNSIRLAFKNDVPVVSLHGNFEAIILISSMRDIQGCSLSEIIV